MNDASEHLGIWWIATMHGQSPPTGLAVPTSWRELWDWASRCDAGDLDGIIATMSAPTLTSGERVMAFWRIAHRQPWNWFKAHGARLSEVLVPIGQPPGLGAALLLALASRAHQCSRITDPSIADRPWRRAPDLNDAMQVALRGLGTHILPLVAHLPDRQGRLDPQAQRKVAFVAAVAGLDGVTAQGLLDPTWLHAGDQFASTLGTYGCLLDAGLHLRTQRSMPASTRDRLMQRTRSIGESSTATVGLFLRSALDETAALRSGFDAASAISQAMEPCSFTVMSHLRIALIIGDVGTATAMLDHRRAWCAQTWLDDVAHARLAAMAGHEDEAVRGLRTVRNAAEAAKSAGRLECELILARELSPLVLIRESAAPVAPTTAAIPRRQPGSAEPPPMLGSSAAMAQVRALIDVVAPGDQPVLLTGETGTGKDLVALTIHSRSERRRRPFVAVNCPGISDPLAESELFGHSKGAFTGAERTRTGLAAAAKDGVLFLDEIGDATPHLQVILLRILENREYRPVGSDARESLQARIIAATNADLHRAVRAGSFRGDLLHRLDVLRIHLPPLRERRADIPEIAAWILRGDDGPASPLDAELAERLSVLPWPGNVRQLRNAMERLRMAHPGRRLFDVAAWRAMESVFGAACGLDDVGGDGKTNDPPTSGTAMAEPLTDADADDQGPGDPRSRRLAMAKRLFLRHGTLTRKRLMELTGISQRTATLYLQELIRRGEVEKIAPTAAPATHYFRRRPGSPA